MFNYIQRLPGIDHSIALRHLADAPVISGPNPFEEIGLLLLETIQ